MIRTYGLTHIALAVKDLKRTLQFYKEVFGAVPMYEEETWAQVQTPGTHDVIVFEEKPSIAGKANGGVQHFGFRLVDPVDISKIKDTLNKIEAEVIDSGEFVPGEPYIFFLDPDGYEIEVWYEKPLGKPFL